MYMSSCPYSSFFYPYSFFNHAHQIILSVIVALFYVVSGFLNKVSLLGAPLKVLSQKGLASHLLGLGQAHGSQNSRSNVTKDTALLLEAPALRSIGHDERHLVGGVASLGLSIGELHLLSIAVVGSDEQDVAFLLAGVQNLSNGLISGGTANDSGLVDTGVAHHVRGSKVVHDEGELLLCQTLGNLVGNSIRRHLGSLVVCCNGLVGGNKVLVLVTGLEVEDLLNTTVEEEGDVSVFLSLGNVHLLNVLLSKPLSQNVVHLLGLESNIEGVISLVSSHGNELADLRVGEVGQHGSINISQELSDLSRTIGSVVEEEDGVII